MKGEKHPPSTYRPVSLTFIVCKVLENVGQSSVIDNFDRFEINMVLMPDDHLNLNSAQLYRRCLQGDKVDVILFDLAKAFDKVPQ